MKSIEQQFFNDLEKKLWTAADKLRSNLDAAVYKHESPRELRRQISQSKTV